MDKRTAIISESGKFRYLLTRTWDDTLPVVLFIMLNPSKADAHVNDPTILKCISMAKNWGYGGIEVCNLFPFRATDPKELLAAESIGGDEWDGPNNAWFIEQANKSCAATVLAWGNTPIVKKLFKKFPRYQPLPSLVQNAHYLKLLKDGAPGHPLFLKARTTMKPKGFQAIFHYLEK